MVEQVVYEPKNKTKNSNIMFTISYYMMNFNLILFSFISFNNIFARLTLFLFLNRFVFNLFANKNNLYVVQGLSIIMTISLFIYYGYSFRSFYGVLTIVTNYAYIKYLKSLL